MSDFFIEFRFHGDAQRYLRGLVHEIARKFRVRGAIRERPVPHMALFYGTPGTADIQKVCTVVKKVGGRYNLVPFKIEGFDLSDGEKGKVIAAGISASPELKKLRQELATALSEICTPHRFDTQPEFWFHSTIAFKDIDRKFDQIWRYINTKEKIHINQHLLRITVLNKNQKIIGEYDLILKEWLNRDKSLDMRLWRKTINRLRELQGLPPEKSLSFSERIISRIKNIGAKKSIFLIGDTHFDHKNIIEYCDRPFRDVQEMNETLVKNWNDTVKTEDIVYFLGDWAFGRGSKPAKYWVRKLNGHIISIKGSHDDERTAGIRFANSQVLDYKEHTFLLIHDPSQVNNWHGWVIHGHKHNNDLNDYPFINGEKKTINVSVELINYCPLNIDKLLSLNIDSIKRMQTIDREPERW